MLAPLKVPLRPLWSASAREPSLTLSVTLNVSAASLALASAGVTFRPVSTIAAWFSVVICASGVETTGVSGAPITVPADTVAVSL